MTDASSSSLAGWIKRIEEPLPLSVHSLFSLRIWLFTISEFAASRMVPVER